MDGRTFRPFAIYKLHVEGESEVGEIDGLKVAVGSCVGMSDGVYVGSSNEGEIVGET